MRITYLGESEINKGDRFAIIDAKTSECDLIDHILDDLMERRYPYNGYISDDELTYYVEVDDKNDFDDFASWFRELRRDAVKTAKGR